MTTTTADQLDDVVAATPEKLREQAVLRLKKRRDFKAHLVAYVVVNLVVWGPITEADVRRELERMAGNSF